MQHVGLPSDGEGLASKQLNRCRRHLRAHRIHEEASVLSRGAKQVRLYAVAFAVAAFTAAARLSRSASEPTSITPSTAGARSTLVIVSAAFASRPGVGLAKFSRFAALMVNWFASAAGTGTEASIPLLVTTVAAASTEIRYSSKL